MVSYRGTHSTVDCVNFFCHSDFAEHMLQIAKITILENSELKIVGQKLVIFDGITSPAGFTFVVLLDASHLSAHCYSDEGLLALDVFTCGDNDPERILKEFVKQIKNNFPQSKFSSIVTHKRFPEKI